MNGTGRYGQVLDKFFEAHKHGQPLHNTNTNIDFKTGIQINVYAVFFFQQCICCLFLSTCLSSSCGLSAPLTLTPSEMLLARPQQKTSNRTPVIQTTVQVATAYAIPSLRGRSQLCQERTFYRTKPPATS